MIQCHAAHRFQNRIPWANQSYSYTHASPFGLRSNRSQQRSPKVKKLQAHNLCPNVVVFLLGCLPVNREMRIAKRWTVGKLKRTKIQFPANFQRACHAGDPCDRTLRQPEHSLTSYLFQTPLAFQFHIKKNPSPLSLPRTPLSLGQDLFSVLGLRFCDFS